MRALEIDWYSEHILSKRLALIDKIPIELMQVIAYASGSDPNSISKEKFREWLRDAAYAIRNSE